jgi:hypothetical protein
MSCFNASLDPDPDLDWHQHGNQIQIRIGINLMSIHNTVRVYQMFWIPYSFKFIKYLYRETKLTLKCCDCHECD